MAFYLDVFHTSVGYSPTNFVIFPSASPAWQICLHCTQPEENKECAFNSSDFFPILIEESKLAITKYYCGKYLKKFYQKSTISETIAAVPGVLYNGQGGFFERIVQYSLRWNVLKHVAHFSLQPGRKEITDQNL